jgi:2-iminobutanoate/2-iminopropanoate deaminase
MQAPEKEIVIAENAPKPIGPYSAGIRAGHLVFTAGQIGLVPDTGELISGGITQETRQVLKNIENILQAAGSSLDLIVKTTVFLQEMSDFGQMNEVYGEFFQTNPPARSTVEVRKLPKGAGVEIEAIALVSQPRGD